MDRISKASTIENLPNELLALIASHLEFSPPSIFKFAHEPSLQLTCSDQHPLKCLSQVSWRWRKIVLPVLFRYSRIALDSDPQWVPIDARLIENMQGQLTSLSDHELQIYTKMRSKFKSSSMFAFDEAFDDLLINLCRVQEGDNILKSVPNILWLPHLKRDFSEFARFVEQYELKHHIQSLVIYTDKEYELAHITTADAPLGRAVAEIWSRIFTYFDPWRVVVAAPPPTLAGLLHTQMMSADAWAFQMKLHYIELLHSETQRIQHLSSTCRPWDEALIHQRPWSHLSYNEGSSVAAYSTYEYHLKQSPRMLYLILLHLAKDGQDCCNIRSFTFHGVFPFSTNITTIVCPLVAVRSLREVRFQLAPGKENDVLSDTKRLGRAQSQDLWMEWNESYKVISWFLAHHGFERGGLLISLDCDDEARENEVEENMIASQSSETNWKKLGRGTWIKEGAPEQNMMVSVVDEGK
jgi:hypothetical protein